MFGIRILQYFVLVQGNSTTIVQSQTYGRPAGL